MKTKLLLFCLFLLSVGTISAQAPANDNCASATNLVSGASPLCAQTTDGGSVQAGEVVTAATVGASSNFSQSIWYKFTATSANMFVEWEFTGLTGGATWCPGRISMVVYNSSVCIPGSGSILATESAASDGSIVMTLTGLTIGNTYLVQVGYNDGSGCQVPVFCMRVGNTPTPCSCASPCTAGCGYSTTPTVAQVTSSCPQYDLTPIGDGGTTTKYCYSFTANTTTVNFSMIISSNCSGGNVSALTWTLSTSACASNFATGTLSNMSASGLTVGQSYVLCYQYTIPTSCHHSGLYPYFVGAVPLPIELINFKVRPAGRKVNLTWSTASEENNDFFTIERTKDGNIYEVIGTVEGAGDSHKVLDYSFEDPTPYKGISYYRLKQTDLNKQYKYTDLKSVMVGNNEEAGITLIPNPTSNEVTLKYTCVSSEKTTAFIYNYKGEQVKAIEMNCTAGENSTLVDLKDLSDGIYFVILNSAEEVYKAKLIKKL
jgi:hypothetical protein